MDIQIERMARRMARSFAFHYRGNANDNEDYFQEAMCVVLEIREHCDPSRDFQNYARGAIRRRLYWYATKEHAPVIGSTHSIRALNVSRSTELTDRIQHLITPEFLLHSARWALDISMLIQDAFERVPDGEVARKVLLDGLPAGEVAYEHSFPLWRVYRATRKVRKAIRTDRRLQTLWENA